MTTDNWTLNCRKTKTPTSLAAPRGFYSRQRPSLPHSCPRSTIGPERLNFRVRDGNGCDPLGKVTGKPKFKERVFDNSILMGKPSARTVMIHQCDMIKPHDRLVRVS